MSEPNNNENIDNELQHPEDQETYEDYEEISSEESSSTDEEDVIPDNELDPENNPMRISGSKYLSKNATKIMFAVGAIGIFIVFTALLGDDIFGSPKKDNKEEKNNRVAVFDNSMNADIINKNAGSNTIIPAQIKDGLITDNSSQYSNNSLPFTTQNDGTNKVIIENNHIKLLDPKTGIGNYHPQTQKTIQASHEKSEKQIQHEKILNSKIQLFTASVGKKSKVNFKVEKSEYSDKSDYSVPYSSDDEYENIEKTNSYIAKERQRIQQSLSNMNNPNSDFNKKINAMRNGGVYQPNTTSETKFAISVDNNSRDDSKWELNSTVQNPKKLSVMTGFVIPATLITGINSDLPGSIIAQVSQNVYDTATGRHTLIPQGTKIFGKYESGIIFGQERVLVSWNRLIFPDGKNIDIGQMAGTDQAGYSGFSDLVNNHYLKLFTSSLLLSVISAGVTYSQDKYSSNNSNNQTTASGTMAQSLGNQLGNTTIQMIQKHMNISPTLEIRPGYKLNVMVSKDIIFSKPYKNYDY